MALGLVVSGSRWRAALDRLAVARNRGEPLALAAQGERLVFDHGLEPRHELFLARGRRLREQDLEPALVGVLGVVGVGGVAPGGRENLCAVPGEQRERCLVDLAPGGPRAPL